MNLKIDLEERICLNQNIAFLTVKIIGEKINIYKSIVMTDNINVNIDELEVMKNYKLIVSVVIAGKQVFKKFKEFTYKSYDEYIIDSNIKINRQLNNNILEKISLINKNHLKNICISINPLIAYRKESNGKISIHSNGGILLLREKLSDMFKEIIDNKYIINVNDVDNLNILLLKGCLIAYEK